MEEERRCDNCKFYKEHYFEYNSRYVKTYGASCVNSKIQANSRISRIKKNVACEEWQPYELQVKEKMESIEKVIRDMHKKLSQIEQILNRADDK